MEYVHLKGTERDPARAEHTQGKASYLLGSLYEDISSATAVAAWD